MRNLILIAIMFGFFACNQAPSYKVNVKLTAGDGKAYLSQRIKGTWVNLDSTELKNGGCKFVGVVKNPEVLYFNVSTRKDKLPFFIENASITINGSLDSLTTAKVTGSKTQDEYQTLQNKLDILDKQASDLSIQSKGAEKSGNKAKADSLMVLSDGLYSKIDNEQTDYIKANPASYVSPYLLSRVYYEMEADVLEGYIKGLKPNLDSVPFIVTLKDRVAKLKLVSVGQIAPDFTLNDTMGNPVKLSDVYAKNQYTLVDFWASWCGPCRRENPNVVATFNQYKSKGFGVIGISLDNDKAKWEKAIADDQLTWTHVSDLKKWKNLAVIMYSVNSIPANLLVDKTGKIIARNIREAKLRDTMAGLLK
jgi:peroxiredoxin